MVGGAIGITSHFLQLLYFKFVESVVLGRAYASVSLMNAYALQLGFDAI